MRLPKNKSHQPPSQKKKNPRHAPTYNILYRINIKQIGIGNHKITHGCRSPPHSLESISLNRPHKDYVIGNR